MDFHGDRVSSSGEQHLLKSENYPDHPFATKHTVRQKFSIFFLSIPSSKGFISYKSIRSWSYSFRINTS
jgi:hypothetical protein